MGCQNIFGFLWFFMRILLQGTIDFASASWSFFWSVLPSTKETATQTSFAGWAHHDVAMDINEGCFILFFLLQKPERLKLEKDFIVSGNVVQNFKRGVQGCSFLSYRYQKGYKLNSRKDKPKVKLTVSTMLSDLTTNLFYHVSSPGCARLSSFHL